MIENDLIHTPEFLRCLRGMLINAPTTWSDASRWDSLSEIEHRALQRLHAAGLVSFRLVVELEWQPRRQYLLWTISGGIVRSTFETTGPRVIETIRMMLLIRFGLVRNGKTVTKLRFAVLGQHFQFRLSDEGALARSDLQSGVREKVRYVDHFMVGYEAVQRVEEVCSAHNTESFSPMSSQASSVAVSQSTASIGDVNVHVNPNIHIQNVVSGPFKLELPEGVVVGKTSATPVDPEGKKSTPPRKPKADRDACNRKLDQWAKDSRGKCFELTHEEVAAKLECSVGMVGSLPAWKAAKLAGLVPEKIRRDNSVRTASIDGRTMDQFPGKSDQERQEELDALIDEQQQEMKSEFRSPR